MESAPLTLAYEHAKAASIATQTSDTTTAIGEHTNAAGEFAKAAETTDNKEALRTIKLLEAHHRQLSTLLKFPAENPITLTPATLSEAEVTTAQENNVSTSAAVAELGAKSRYAKVGHNDAKNGAAIANKRTAAMTSIQLPRRMPPRELSSSIASNLASARGIRSGANARRALSPDVTLAQAPGAMGPPPARRRSRQGSGGEVGKPSWLPPSTSELAGGELDKMEGSGSPNTQGILAQASEQGFQRFYKTFESLVNKVSPSLAFTGLPLISEESSSSSPPGEGLSNSNKKQTRALADSTSRQPDLSKYISKAALRASITQAAAAVNDSFYVVPTSGQTVSYANILSHETKVRRRAAVQQHLENPDFFPDPEGAPDREDEDGFVDARETLKSREQSFGSNPSPSRSRTLRGQNANVDDARVEELSVENQALKEMIDKLSKRLYAFESASQNSTRYLHESIRASQMLMPPPNKPTSSPATPSFSRQGSLDKDAQDQVKALQAKVNALEDLVEKEEKKRHKLVDENEKMKTLLGKYRERWERLKEGAKIRRNDGGSGNADKEGGTRASDGARFVAG